MTYDAAEEAVNRIVAPDNKRLPLQGVWKVERCLTDGDSASNSDGGVQWIGSTVVFTKESVTIGNYSWKKVDYKIKRVEAQEYLLYKYRDSVESLGIKEKEVYVVTVSSENKFLYEFILVGEDRIIAGMDGEYFCLVKTGENAGEVFAGTKGIQAAGEDYGIKEENKRYRSGLLLGLRTPSGSTNGQGGYESYTYRTLWIAAENRVVRDILEAPDLFLPRRTGFWKIEAGRDGHSGNPGGLKAYGVSVEAAKGKATEKTIKKSTIDASGGNGVQEAGVPDRDTDESEKDAMPWTLLYAGNDYISVENGVFLETLSLDNLAQAKGIKISDIAGDNGRLAMETAISGLISSSNVKSPKDVNEENQENSFALYRKTGHWFFKGRINFKQGDDISFTDFNINLIPPKELVAYDVLHTSWKHIKDRVPQAVDVFTSPNGELAVILTRSEVLVYSLEDETIAEGPLKKARLLEGDMVVMAEWATGDYVDRWEKAFINYNSCRNLSTGQ